MLACVMVGAGWCVCVNGRGERGAGGEGLILCVFFVCVFVLVIGVLFVVLFGQLFWVPMCKV